MEETEITFAQTAFSIEAVKNAAYRMARVLDSHIQIVGDQIVCSVRPRDGQTLDSLIVEFRREVIDHDLRIEIRKQTEGVRNLILAHAFSKTGIVTSE